MTKKTIFIAGGGGIGRAAALLLETNEALDCNIYLGDGNEAQIKEAITWISKAYGTTTVKGFVMQKGDTDSALEEILTDCDILLDCLPGTLAPKMAQLAIKHKMHYANLTEYVKETDEIAEMAKNASTGFVLQTGLAPGYINILARKLYQEFVNDFGDDRVEHMQMKVGALSKNALAPHHYAFTWSPIGVATEYVKDAIVVRNNQRILIPALSGRSSITIDGVVYEDNFTSGGAANLPSYFASKIKNIDYKTLRFPGHYRWVEEMLSNIPISENRIDKLFHVLLDKIPMVDDDFVIIYSSVTGKDEQGFLRCNEYSLKVEPMWVGNLRIKAIQSTTASALCEIAYYLLNENKSGVIFQSDIDVDAFLNGPFVQRVYGTFQKN